MNVSFRLIVALSLLVLSAGGSSNIDAKATPEASTKASGEIIPLCKILASPENYTDKRVSVRGTYRVGYEASELYCLSCSLGNRVWVEFDSIEGGGKAGENWGDSSTRGSEP